MFGSKQVHAEPTLIGRGAVVEGTVRAAGRVQVDGRIEGVLEVEGQVSIGPEGRVIGELTTDDLAVGGKVEGKVNARGHVHVLSTGRIEGDVRYDSLQVDRGAVVEGRTLQGEEAAAPIALEIPEPAGSRPSTPAPVAVG